MKRAFSHRRSSSTADRGLAKRQKKYSTREISWEEQKNLGGDFAEVGEGSWPVRRILRERGSAQNRRYLVDWEPHPQTHEEFQPAWESHENVSDHLIRVWEQSKSQHGKDHVQSKEVAKASRSRSRHIIPDSSEDINEQSDAAPQTPSLLSDSSISNSEIPETQEPYGSRSLKIELSPLPDDKSDYDTLRNSNSPHRLGISSTQSSQIAPASQSAPTSPVARRFSRRGTKQQFDSRRSRPSNQSPPNLTSRPSTRPQPAQPLEKSELAIPETPQASPSQSEFSLDQSPAPNSSLAPQPGTASHRLSIPDTRNRRRLSSPFQDALESYSLSPSKAPPAKARASSLTRTPRGSGSISSLAGRIPRIVSPGHQLRRLRIGSNTLPRSLVGVGSEVVFDNMAGPSLDANMREVHDRHPRSPLVNSITQDEVPSNGSLFENADIPNADISNADIQNADIPNADISNADIQNADIQNADIQTADAAPTSLTIQPSIEEETPTDAAQLLDSKVNSSQESLNNPREVETVDGIMIPVRPLLGEHEYTIDLPAEGKVKSAYDEIIKFKMKAVIRFISRKGSPGTSEISNKKTAESNEMQEMLSRLNDTVTHTDLGLALPQTQYSLNEDANAAYAEYAGSKFAMLGCLIDRLKATSITIAIFAQEGPLQDYLGEYLRMKQVKIQRHDRGMINHSPAEQDGLCVELFATQSSNVITLPIRPRFIIAFDVSFTATDSQVQVIRQQHGDDIPIIHFLVTNSSEHVERCVPVWFTSNNRLKVVVRTTYLASPFLGGDICYYPQDSDEPADGAPMGMLDLQRAIRKSPDRKMSAMADIVANLAISGDFTSGWTIDPMPELKLAEFDSPPKMSRAASRTPQPRTARTSAPTSRATTPMGRKRHLDADGEDGSKRLRMTPVRDLFPDSQVSNANPEELVEARKQISQWTSELENMRKALDAAKHGENAARAKAEEWRDTHAELLHRYERNKHERKQLVKQNKKLEESIASMKERNEKYQGEKDILRHQIASLKAELTEARAALKAEGGDAAALEQAHDEARTARAKAEALEKSLTSTKSDFEFTRTQYQEASRQATDLASEVKTLQEELERWKIAADDRKRQLKAMDYEQSISKTMDRAEQFKLECKARDAVIRKLQEENATLKSRRGVQTRGSSVQPASSPGPKSRPASPAPGLLAVPPSGSRASALRNER